MSGDTFDGHNCNRGEWVEARDTAQHPAKPGAAPTPTSLPGMSMLINTDKTAGKNDKVEKYCSNPQNNSVRKVFICQFGR